MQSAEFYFALRIPNSMCGGSSMVEPQFSKLMTRVRSSFSAFPKDEGFFLLSSFKKALVAQWIEQVVSTHSVEGSTPSGRVAQRRNSPENSLTGAMCLG